MGGHRADDERARLILDSREARDLPEVDQVLRLRQPALHRRQQAMASRQELRAVLTLPQQGERLLDRAGSVVVELGWVHAASPLLLGFGGLDGLPDALGCE